MKYDIYFHNDFDGRASAAVMLNFLRSRGDDIERFIPLNFDIIPRWPNLKFKNPAIIMDFPYHPKTTFWFDHHDTSFIKPAWKKNFRSNKFHNWDPKYPSCCSFVLSRLVKNFGFKPPAHLKELAKWADIIDTARYRSPRQTIELKEPALQIAAFIDEKSGDLGLAEEVIKLFATRGLRDVAAVPKIRTTIIKIRDKTKNLLKFYRANVKIFGKLAFVDTRNLKLGELRFAPFYFFPRASYSLRLNKEGGGAFHLGFGSNPWRRPKTKVHIGNFLRERYAHLGSAGGHQDVGGVNGPDKNAIEKAAKEIIEYFK